MLAAGDYGTLELGRATAYAGSNTKYFNGDETEYATAEELAAAVKVNPYGYLKYVRSLNNVTFKAADGAKVNVAGIVMNSGHIYGTEAAPIHDYVLNRDTNSTVNSYNLVHRVNALKFEGLNFTGMVKIGSSHKETKIDGISFENCTFSSPDKTDTKNKGIDISSELGVAAMSGVAVSDCKFSNVYQGVYTRGVRNVSVTGSEFNGTSHNAIAIQDEAVFDHGAVVITSNKFADIGNRVIRFHLVGADTQITIQNNTVTDSGNSGEECMKADTLAEGVTYTISGNDWSGFKAAGNEELTDK